MIATMKKLFGTDGMRGEAGRFPLDAATVRTAGRSLAKHLAKRLGRAPRVVAGRDTRESGEWIERALLEGARAAGARGESAGVITTPGGAYLPRALPADAGRVMRVLVKLMRVVLKLTRVVLIRMRGVRLRCVRATLIILVKKSPRVSASTV